MEINKNFSDMFSMKISMLLKCQIFGGVMFWLPTNVENFKLERLLYSQSRMGFRNFRRGSKTSQRDQLTVLKFVVLGDDKS